METTPPLDRLSDEALVAHVTRLAQGERAATAALIAALAELDARRLYLAEGYSSLFAYCTERLHLSEDAAYYRMKVARAAQALPLVLERLREAGVAVVLTTHDMHEAEALADRVYIVDRGRVTAEGSVAELTAGGSLEDAFLHHTTGDRP